ncbi:MAG: ABC transporter permease subunit [Chloroflexi bacterium]|nr:ABC transporter permease subunit [Chloroflexota bacterium]
MAGLFVLFRKELRQQVRTHRLLIVVAILLFFGLGTPLLLKYMDRFVPENAGVVIPEFTSVEVAQEHIDTVAQVGLIAAILVAMGAVARERESGTAAMVLSKPVGCGRFLTAKLAALAVTFGAALVVGGIGCYLYTVALFGDPGLGHFTAANLTTGLYLLFCLATTLMYSSFFKSQMAAGALALVSLVALAVTSGLPILEDYSPGALLPWSKTIATGSGDNRWGVLVVSLLLTLAVTVIAWQVFKRKEL